MSCKFTEPSFRQSSHGTRTKHNFSVSCRCFHYFVIIKVPNHRLGVRVAVGETLRDLSEQDSELILGVEVGERVEEGAADVARGASSRRNKVSIDE